MPDPIAFMVMPFSRKPTGRTEKDVPAEVDFDALWERVHQPVLQELGYQAVRADRDVGALIITQMIQRLAIADLVVADITLANANVYYEVGVRHAAMNQGCVLVSADWARPVFDLDQMRQLRFPLADGDVSEQAAEAAREVLRRDLKGLVDGSSPVFDAVPGFPKPAVERVNAFADTMAELSRFEADVRAVRAAPESQQADRVRALVERYGKRPAVREIVALELLRTIRDHLGWHDLLDYVEGLPPKLALLPLVLEQQALALAKLGDPAGAVGRLEQLIETHGETAERLGLLGGRYKALLRAAETPRERRQYLNKAIAAYQRGMDVDLNAYYSASNLPRLYRERGEPGDEQRAVEAEVATVLACRAALANGTKDEWVRPTLLGLAFERGDVTEAIRLRAEVEAEGTGRWKLATTIDDLRPAVAAVDDPEVQAALQAVLDQLEELLHGSPSR
jgi:tetratricopeptide (TPR) repeat protein